MPTLAEYRLACGSEIEDLSRYQVGTSTATTTQISALSSSNAGVSTFPYDDDWLYVATGTGVGQQTIIKKGSYVAASGQIGFTVAIASLTTGDFVEISHLFPATRGPGRAPIGQPVDYRTLINRALKRQNVRRRILVQITTANEISLASYPWLDDPRRLVKDKDGLPMVYEASPTNVAIKRTWRRTRITRTGSNPVIEVDPIFESAGGYLTLEVISPADTWINGAESGVGLVNEDDTALVTVDDMVKAFKVEAYQALAMRSPARPSGDWRQMHADALAEARSSIDLYDFGSPQAAPVQAGAA